MLVKIVFRTDPDNYWRSGWTGEVRSKCINLVLTARKTELGGVVKYLTKQDQSKDFNTSFYWNESEIEVLTLMEKLDRLFKDDTQT